MSASGVTGGALSRTLIERPRDHGTAGAAQSVGDLAACAGPDEVVMGFGLGLRGCEYLMTGRRASGQSMPVSE